MTSVKRLNLQVLDLPSVQRLTTKSSCKWSLVDNMQKRQGQETRCPSPNWSQVPLSPSSPTRLWPTEPRFSKNPTRISHLWRLIKLLLAIFQPLSLPLCLLAQLQLSLMYLELSLSCRSLSPQYNSKQKSTLSHKKKKKRLHDMARGILAFQSQDQKPRPHALEGQRPNYQTTKEVLHLVFLTYVRWNSL